MKKKLFEILAVADLFKILANKHFNNFSTSYEIAKAMKELSAHKDFYIAEEKKIVEAYASKDENGQIIIMNGNQIKFDNKENAAKFNAEITDLQKMEVDIFEPFEIKLSDFKNSEMDLTPNDIINLEGFVIFKDKNVAEA